MDYSELANELIDKVHLLRKGKQQKQMNEFIKGEAYILQYLERNNCHTIPSEISEAMGISTARIAAILNSLENKALIVRKIDLSDRRRVLVELTENGKIQAQEQRQKIRINMENTLRALGEKDAKEYLRLTTKLIEIANNSEQI